ncbi:MAG: hypothetical protein R3D68_11595 [Hyphomicrobiaceae bacterium]
MSTVVALIVFAAVAAQSARALEIEFSGRPVKRDILVLYDGRFEKLPHETRAHKFAELPLNHLGYQLTYQDVNGELPAPETLTAYRGVLTWFNEPLRRPERVVEWLDAATGHGLKLVIMGEVAPPETDWLLPSINRVLARLGLEHTGGYVDLTWRAKVVLTDREIVGFERPVDKALPGFPRLKTVGTDAQVHLAIEAPAAGGTRETSVIVATGPGGGFASQSYTIFYEPNTDRVRWTLDPFAFFAKALGRERFPIPDTTTLAGRRIYFSHIDGDGWNNQSEIEGHREAQRLSVEVIEREAIAPYPDLPVTVGLIAGDIDPELGGHQVGRAIAKRLYALPQVEVGSHTYTHPYNWQFFETYDQAAETSLIDAYQPPDLTTRERLTQSVMKLARKRVLPGRYDKYVAGTDDLPRTYLREPFNLDKEVAAALKVSESLAPEGKRAKAYLWSGDTTPFPAAIAAVAKAGAVNINGGDSRLDREYPSVAYVPPISRPAGKERQIYAGNSNENTYTNDWTGPYFGFFMLEHTLKNTDAPRRLKPFNLYYHMYSGEKTAALASIKHFLHLARSSDVIPITASQYSKTASSFFTTRIEQVDLFAWSIEARGTLQTVRFDAADDFEIDLTRSSGVLGGNRHAGALYVSLDPASARSVVALRTRARGPAALPQPPRALLVDSRWQIERLRREPCGFSFEAHGFGPSDMTWIVQPGLSVTARAERNGVVLKDLRAHSDAAGRLKLAFDVDGRTPLQVKVACDGR